MTAISRHFLLKIIILSFLLLAISTALFSTVLKMWQFAAYPYQILLIALVTTIGHLWIVKAAGENTRKFTTAFMASVTLKLMVYLTFMLVYLLYDHSQVIPFVLTFIALYIIYTIFEVIEVLNIIKINQKSV
ncbi:MAG TPA: hypothetical protein VFC41_05115 [Anaerovoracaceae bacterium]|nr:hypothetical protein [Anaerovoracaceae bacterium]